MDGGSRRGSRRGQTQSVEQLLRALESLSPEIVVEHQIRIRRVLLRALASQQPEQPEQKEDVVNAQTEQRVIQASSILRVLMHDSLIHHILKYVGYFNLRIPQYQRVQTTDMRTSRPDRKCWLARHRATTAEQHRAIRVERELLRSGEAVNSVCQTWRQVCTDRESYIGVRRFQYKAQLDSLRSELLTQSVSPISRLRCLCALNNVTEFRRVWLLGPARPGLVRDAVHQWLHNYFSELPTAIDSDEEGDHALERVQALAPFGGPYSGPGSGSFGRDCSIAHNLFGDCDGYDTEYFDGIVDTNIVLDILYNRCELIAVCAGAIDVINELNKNTTAFIDEREGGTFNNAIHFACSNVHLEGPVRGIKALLETRYQLPLPRELLHPGHNHGYCLGGRRVRGTQGNLLHYAVMHGHKSLVELLLKIGFLNKTYFPEYPLDGDRKVLKPEEYAINYGYPDIAEMLRTFRLVRRDRPILLSLHRPDVKYGTLIHFEVTKNFGFIEPDDDDDDNEDNDGEDHVFVHGSILRKAAQNRPVLNQEDNPEPTLLKPGMRLAFTQERNSRGGGRGRSRRFRATAVANEEDGSYIDLVSFRSNLLISREEMRWDHSIVNERNQISEAHRRGHYNPGYY